MHISYLPALFCLCQLIQRCEDDSSLELVMKKHAKVMTHHKRNKSSSGVYISPIVGQRYRFSKMLQQLELIV